MKLGQLQALSDRKGRVNTVHVRANPTERRRRGREADQATFAAPSVTTAADLADRVGGSLADAKDLSGKLGTALTSSALVGRLPDRHPADAVLGHQAHARARHAQGDRLAAAPVVRQVTGESLAQGALGGVLGALIGIGGAALDHGARHRRSRRPWPRPAGAAGPRAGRSGPSSGSARRAITSGSEHVTLDAPVDLGLIALAIALALLGGLIAGAVGGLRAARLRPADALRHID